MHGGTQEAKTIAVALAFPSRVPLQLKAIPPSAGSSRNGTEAVFKYESPNKYLGMWITSPQALLSRIIADRMIEHRSLGLTTRGDQIAACAIVTVILAGLFVILRFYTRTRMLNILGRDDWFILAALLFSVANTVAMVIQVQHGLGQHMALLSTEQLTVFLKGSYVSIPMYNISLTLAKISVLFTYMRIFTTRSTRRICNVILVIVIIYGLWATLSAFFTCIPINAYWDLTIKGKCLPKGPVWFANAGINIATDFGIVLVPATLIRQLQLSMRQKIGLYMVFMVGLFICIVSILRLHSLYLATITKDPTWENIGVANWSNIELNTAILCACLPTLRPLILRLFPSLLPSGHGRTAYYQPSSGNTAFRTGNKSYVASNMDRTIKRTIVVDTSSETGIVTSTDDFPLTDMDSEDAYSRKKGDIEDGEVTSSAARSNTSSAAR
ncbi:hypothetical protein FB567DRAFT_538784 [Paraphoma chrysanthemicola]|uniref:Rhodopsin domain-containing protein n=1 Tax=Paraphoma chrysanthemicola TaxID=798071 RepID=A0A8K0VSW9_9PLEO|nr:hypothetical protein FB567DRAFT_538784 [Paraphoma chrysanthemicola]